MLIRWRRGTKDKITIIRLQLSIPNALEVTKYSINVYAKSTKARSLDIKTDDMFCPGRAKTRIVVGFAPKRAAVVLPGLT
jgi:hypothetical protein